MLVILFGVSNQSLLAIILYMYLLVCTKAPLFPDKFFIISYSDCVDSYVHDRKITNSLIFFFPAIYDTL